MQRITAREGLPIDVDAETAQSIRRRLVALQTELRPRIGFTSSADASLVVQNLVGSVQLAPDLVLDVVPKTEPDKNWAAALIDLLIDDRVEFGGETPDAEQMPRLVLADALARLYAAQLEFAIRREGPLSILVRRQSSKQRLAGRLDVTTWVTSSITRPGDFPQQETLLSADNHFTGAMAWVAEALAVRASDARMTSKLRGLARRLRPGLPEHTVVDPGVAARPIPPQWSAYAPAWATTCAVLRRISPLSRSGILEGFGLAVEPWPLLERLLVRSLHAAARQAASMGVSLRAQGHSSHQLLTASPSWDGNAALARLPRNRQVEPDGTLWFENRVVAAFEAKYSRADSDTTFRGHVFQAMTTAAALRAPLAVLVYPEPSDPVTWTVHGFDGKPLRLAAVGLDMFAYRRGAGDESRGAALLNVLRSMPLSSASPEYPSADLDFSLPFALAEGRVGPESSRP